MKKILCLALVLILTMSVAITASAADATTPGINLEQIGSSIGSAIESFEMPKFASLDEAFSALAEFLKFEAIMVYVDEFHVYMADFYKELNVALKGFGLVINGILSTLLAATK